MLENIQERFDGMEAGAHLQPHTTQTREEEYLTLNREDHEDFSDQIDEEST